MGFVVKRDENYSARLVIPKALRPIFGKNEFKQSLGTTSKKEAELLAAPLVLRWKKLIEEAKTDGVKAKAKTLRQAFMSDKDNDKLDEDGAETTSVSPCYLRQWTTAGNEEPARTNLLRFIPNLHSNLL